MVSVSKEQVGNRSSLLQRGFQMYRKTWAASYTASYTAFPDFRFASSVFPLSVNRYCCRLLLGLSGSVHSITVYMSLLL